MPAPSRIVDFLHRFDVHGNPQKMLHPAAQNLGQRLESRSGIDHVQDQTMGQLVLDFVGHVEQKSVTAQAFALRKISLGIVFVQHFHIHRFEGGSPFNQHAPHFAQTPCGLQCVQRVAVTGQHTARL